MSTNNLALPAYQNVGKSGAMALGTIAANVIRARKRKGWSTAQLAREVGVALNTIQSIEKGATRKSRYLPDIARVLDVPLSEIDPAQASNGETPALVPRRDVIGERDLPVYGTTEAGEGLLVMTSEAVDRADRPVSLTHVRDAYGVIVAGDSMIPVVRPGDVVCVHPHLQPRRGDLCVFRCDRDGEFRSTIKEFVAVAKDGWRVKRYQPAERESVLKPSDWPECHVVVTIHRR